MEAGFWEYGQYPVFFVLGAVVSLINSIAGGGSSLSLPLLIFLGIPPTVANGTNRIGLIVGKLSSVMNLTKHGYLDKKIFRQLFVPSLVGTFMGLFFVVSIGDKAFQAVIAAAICLVVIMSRLRKDILGKPPETPPEKLTAKGAIGFALVSLYGCIVPVGVGFVQIFSLTRYTGLDAIHVNALKNCLTTVFLVVSTAGLAFADKINWPVAVIMAAGAWVGGYLGSTLQRKKGNKFIENFVSVSSLALATYLIIDLVIH